MSDRRAVIDTSRIGMEKARRANESLNKELSEIRFNQNELDETMDGLLSVVNELMERVSRLEKSERGNDREIEIEIVEKSGNLYLKGYEDTEDTVKVLREQLDLLDVKYHSANKVPKLRELLNNACSGRYVYGVAQSND